MKSEFPNVTIEPGAVIGNESLDIKASRRINQTGVVFIGDGSFIGANTTIALGRSPDEPTIIGANVNIAPLVMIGHGCIIEDDVIIHGGARLAGFVTVHKGARIGMGACIRNRVTIGKGAMVALGAVVTKDVPPFEIWGGVPARKLRDREVFPSDPMASVLPSSPSI